MALGPLLLRRQRSTERNIEIKVFQCVYSLFIPFKEITFHIENVLQYELLIISVFLCRRKFDIKKFLALIQGNFNLLLSSHTIFDDFLLNWFRQLMSSFNNLHDCHYVKIFSNFQFFAWVNSIIKFIKSYNFQFEDFS